VLMLGSPLAHPQPRCKRLKSVLCVGCTALCISLTAVFISDCAAHCALVMQHRVSQRAVWMLSGIDFSVRDQ